jgi:hypothetical protein
VNVTAPETVDIGVQVTLNVAWFAPSLFFGAVCVASDHPIEPFAIDLVDVSPVTGAKVPRWLDRMLKPAAFCVGAFWLVTTKVSVMDSAVVRLVALAVSETIGAIAVGGIVV